MAKHIVSSSDGTFVRFHDSAEFEKYKHECMLLDLRYYKRDRDAHGIWASNQGRYVTSVHDLSEWDCRHMEDLLTAHAHEL